MPPVEIYQEFRQLDWQKAIEVFAPIMEDIAQHYDIEIKSPGNLNERNDMLANFIAQELAKASESQNKPLEQYVQNEMAENALKTSKLEVSQGQKDFIAKVTDQSLEQPEFSSSLEASVYNLSKFDDNKKAEKAEEMADQIRAAAQFKAEPEISLEVQKPRGLTMR